jgi:membrane fusion protein (multidrug efflux system)
MKLNRTRISIAVGAGIAIVAGASWWAWSLRYEDTDNAYTAAHVATLSPKVGGLVTDVLVEENYRVKKDQVLVRIDPRDFQNAVENLKAEMGGVTASLELAHLNYRRSMRLLAQKAVPEQDRDNDRTRVQELVNKRESLKAQLAQAELNLSFTQLRAPSDGIVGKKLVEAGMVVNPAQPLLSFVDSQAPWVVANFKETQLRKMRIGQMTEIQIDSIGGRVFEGVIESFSPGSGATFALIPPDNATGNFTKIVQRVPVRIRFVEDSIRGYEDRIVPGLSAEASVDLQSNANWNPTPQQPLIEGQRAGMGGAYVQQ